MKKWLTIFTMFILVNSVSYGYVYSDYTWESYGAKEYALTLDVGDWDIAEAEAVAVGGHLVTINTLEENNWLVSTFSQVVDDDLWIGLYQLPGSPEPAGGWVWISGEPVTHVGWSGLEPNNNPDGEDYAVIRNTDWGWNDWGQVSSDYHDTFGIIEVPEPATVLTLGLGALALRRKRRK